MPLNIPPIQNAELNKPVPNLTAMPLQSVTTEQVEEKLNASDSEQKLQMLKDIAYLFQSTNIFPTWIEKLTSTHLSSNWSPEQIDEAWQVFTNWIPSEDKSLLENLGQLQQLYLALKGTVDQGGDASMALQLETYLNQALIKLIDTHLGELKSFFVQNGQPETPSFFKGNLFKAITNSNMPASTERANIKSVSQSISGKHTNIPAAHTEVQNDFIKTEPTHKKEGFIYHPTGGKTIAVNKPYSYQAEWETLQSISKLTKTQIQEKGIMEQLKAISNSTYESEHQNTPISSQSFSVQDLEHTAKFIKYLNTNRYHNFTAKEQVPSEEALGFRMAILELKSQIFADYSGVGFQMGEAVKQAIHQVIYQYLTKANEALTMNKNPAFTPLDKQQAYSVYNQMLKYYDNTKNPKEAILKGLSYAQKEFLDKLNSKENVKAYRYNSIEKFWSQLFENDKHLLITNLKEAFLEIRKDWNNFIRKLEFGKHSILELDKELGKLGAFSMVLKGTHTPLPKSDFGSFFMVGYWSTILMVVIIVCTIWTVYSEGFENNIIFFVALFLIFSVMLFLKLTKEKTKHP